MDYLDPQKAFRHRILLFTGYIFIAVAIVIATLILVYQAYGFGVGKNGKVIQNGLIFFSSQPHPANIYINGKLNKAKTNARLVMPESIYKVQLARDGYRNWQRTIVLDGGSVAHFDYPLLYPQTLSPKKVGQYASAPTLSTQSPDRRWLVVGQPGALTQFDVFDLKNPDKAPTNITIPATLLSKATTSESWQLGEWADDNQHVLLQHIYDGKTEWVLVDRTSPDQSLNLNTTLSSSPTKLTLNNRKYDQYYIYNGTSGDLQKASLRAPAPVTTLQHVLAYRSYSDDTIMYATDANTPVNTVQIKLLTGTRTYTLRSFPAGTTYLLDLTKYSGTLYAVVSASSQNKVYIYKDPIAQLNSDQKVLVPTQVLHVNQPNYISFSTNTQFIMAENATQFGVYDILNKNGYNYTNTHALDAPVTHATWMDGNRLTYTSSGKMLVFDYDNTNQQQLVDANSNYVAAFGPDYKFFYTLANSQTTPNEVDLNRTSLLAPADQ